jgi:transposase
VIHAAEQDRPDVAERRALWKVEQLGLDPRKLIFIDETWAKTNMPRLRGRAPIGQRLVEKAPHGQWKTPTLIAALDHRGIRCASTVDGPINGDVFIAFIQQVLTPKLRPGDLGVPDKLSAHKVAGVREAVASVGAKLVYLPPYSPDLNPIELAFSKLKQLLRSAKHRRMDEFGRDPQRMLDAITPGDANNIYRHCVYGLRDELGCSGERGSVAGSGGSSGPATR